MDKTRCLINISLTILLLITFQIPCLATSLDTDRSALVSLKSHLTLHPHAIITKNWTNSSYVCSWIGVTCGLHHRRVTALNMSRMGLYGTLPPQLGNLSFLVSLDLSYNHFTGVLPQQFSLLHRLKFIRLSVNNFTEEIPSWFGILSELVRLSLRSSTFTGFIPKSLSNLSNNLQHLDLSYNSLHGEIPQELGRLDNLQILRMQGNHLSGVIPSAIYNISTLRTIAFAFNELSGSLPTGMCRNLPLLEEIYLSNNHLSGQIPSNLSNCTQLRYLSLANNSLSGQIPPAIGNLKSLQYLYLGGNQLQGDMPHEIGNLQNLLVFAIEWNQITGTLDFVKNLTSLQDLRVWRNKVNGNFSTHILNLTILTYLDLRENELTGILPREIGQFDRLWFLGLSSNSFSGMIPAEIFNISTLRILKLSNNTLSGGLPTNLCYGTPLLEGLYLSINNLNGAIPTSIYKCAHLKFLSLSNNEFSGFVPQFLGNLTLLETLYLGTNYLKIESSSAELSFITSLTNCRFLKNLAIEYNPLRGIIPASIGNFSANLQIFSVLSSQIKGGIPTYIGNLSGLVELDLSMNELSGNIPCTLNHMKNLQGLDLNSNNLSSSIPGCLCHLPSISELYLYQNQLSGSIPECFGDISSLRILDLGSNMLTSSIPSSLWNLGDLLELDLSQNSLVGNIPPEMANLVGAYYVNLSFNQLSQSIPTTIGKLQKLTNLSLAHNKLESFIPESVGIMISLITLDLSFNNLSGPIPNSIEKLQQLQYFNVSYNSLTGEIPTDGPFRNFTMESFLANKGLCGIKRFNVPLCRRVRNHMSRREKIEISLFILAGMVALSTVLTLLFIFIKNKRKNKVSNRDDEWGLPERISYYEILQATEQLNESNLLGIGSSGSVFRGILSDGRVIAVKVFNLQIEAASKSFDVECQVLRNIRHKNLTKVISSCSTEDFKALVLEYMPMGNLEKWLYSHNYCLDFMQRLNIMTDIACALEYLHHGYSTPIVHCDLKPSNVLLDEDMIAHVSDFGIAKLVGNEDSTVLTNTLATLGYIAPEYGLEGLVSTRSDVYSYGVMLIETFTRKRPSDDTFGGEYLSLKSWVESLLPHSPNEVIDANLLIDLDVEQHNKMLQCVSSILMLGLKCSAESPRDRITMKEAVSELYKIKCQCAELGDLNYIQR